MAATEAMEDESENAGCGKGHVLEEFKEIEEVRSLIDGLKDIYNDLIAREASCERFTGTKSDHMSHEYPNFLC